MPLHRIGELVGTSSKGDPKGANLSKRTKHKRDHPSSSLEPVVVALGGGNGNRLGDIRPKRTRNISERAQWFNRALAQQVLGIDISESEVREGLMEVECFLGLAFAPGTLNL
jgi:hypothetical protein